MRRARPVTALPSSAPRVGIGSRLGRGSTGSPNHFQQEQPRDEQYPHHDVDDPVLQSQSEGLTRDMT